MTASLDDVLAMALFARVVEARSFTAAASALGLSKSAVSTRVAQLEARLGVRLLQRTTRHVSPTEDGLSLYERARRVVQAADEATEAAEQAQGEPRGTLRVTAPAAFSETYLGEPLAAFARACPAVSIELLGTDRTVSLLEEGIDVAIRVTRLRDSSLVARRLAFTQSVACASPAYLAKHGEPASPVDLVGHECLRYALVSRRDEWRFEVEGREVSVPVRGRFVATTGAMLLAATLAGMGIAVLPSFLTSAAIARGDLRPILAGFPTSEFGVYAVHAHTRHAPAKVRAFVDALATHFRKPRW